MLIKIPGVDPIMVKNIKDQTAKPVVRASRQIRITDKEKQKPGREWFQQGKRKDLEAFIEEINDDLEKQGHPVRFSLLEFDGKLLVEVKEVASGKVLRWLTLAEAQQILGRALKSQGFVVDEKV